ncbi:MAG: WD40 repeat domain-containing protein [Pyrinomonadaceae bacterium]
MNPTFSQRFRYLDFGVHLTVQLNISDGSVFNYLNVNGGPVAFSSNGLLAVNNGRISVYRLSDGCFLGQTCNTSPTPLFTDPDGFAHGRSIAFTPDGSRLAIGGGEYFQFPLFHPTVRLLSVPDGTLIRTYQVPDFVNHQNRVFIDISPDGETLATGVIYDLNLWSISDGTLTRNLAPFNTPLGVRGVVYSPDGQIVASVVSGGGNSKKIHLWRGTDGELLRVIDTGVSFAQSTPLAYSPDGQTIAVGFSDSDQIQLRRASDGTLLDSATASQHFPVAVAYSPDSQLLASLGGRGELIMWRVSSGSLIRHYSINSRFSVFSSAVAFSPNGQTFSTGGALFRTSDGAFLGEFIGHAGQVSSIAFSPDGQTQVTGEMKSGDRVSAARLWRVSDRALLHTLSGHQNWVRSVAFAPDGNTVISVGDDATVRLWRVSNGGLLRTYDQETNFSPFFGSSSLLSVAHSPNGNLFAYGRADSTLVVARNPFITPRLRTDIGLTRLNSSTYLAFITVTNDGAVTAHDVRLTNARLGNTTGAGLPQAFGDLPPGTSFTFQVQFPTSAGAAGTRTSLTYGGAYAEGTFSGARRIVLP